MRAWRRAIGLVLCASLALTACSTPSERIDRMARDLGLERLRLNANGFELRVYRHAVPAAAGRLHIYLGGDGRPWRTRTSISTDPTPGRPLTLELMALDATPSLYLGRPCYFGESAAPGCDPRRWTSGRYSETVVSTMAVALGDLIARENLRELTLIGYSGGGVIAWLLAARLPQVTRLVTVAANLNLAAWAGHHGYSPLSGSLDPAQQPRLPARVEHWHLVAKDDRQVPLAITTEAAGSELAGATIRLFEGDHQCCWVDHWPAILALLERP